MIDLPKIIKSKRQQEALSLLNHINANNLPYMEKDVQKRFLDDLHKRAGLFADQATDKFDRNKMNQLHALYSNMGGQRKKGGE